MKLLAKKHFWKIYMPLSVIYGEMLLQLWCFGELGGRSVIYASLFGTAACCVAMLICLSSSPRFFRRLYGIVLFLAFLLFATQSVYFRIFKAFLSLASVGQAGMVLENFWREALIGILRTAPMLLLQFLPTLFWLIFGRKLRPESISFRARAVYAALFLLLQGGATVLVSFDTGGIISASYLYNESYVPELSVRNFGAVTNLKQDLLSLPGIGLAQSAAPSGTDSTNAENAKPDSLREPASTVPDSANDDAVPAEYAPHVLEIDFERLISGETNAEIAAVHEFFAESEPSYENEYTGLWQGKNLIWIVAEGFSTWAVDKDLTPTLYMLANSGFVFENFYNPLWYVSTSDGEFTTLLSLLPRSGVWSMSRSSSNLMPFGMGSMLKDEGYACYAFHNGYATYYDRDKSHPNLGYSFYANGGGLEVSDVWPPSDLEMMLNSVPMYIGDEPFHTYYMTISGHMYYTFAGNMQSSIHRAEVEHLPYSSNCQAYVACNIELDLAIEELISSLDEAGILENTAIVLSGDHYPYGLEYDEIDELNGSVVERNFELYRSTLIMWSGDMTEPVYVDKLCSSLDILPTICNLMGLDYDSRLTMGRDILSDSEALVVFGNRSFITDKGRYNTTTNTFTPVDEKAWESADEMSAYARSVMDRVNLMFEVSRGVIDYDYYSKIFTEGT